MKQLLIAFLLIPFCLSSQGYKVQKWEAAPLGGVSNMSDNSGNFLPVLTYLETPDGISKRKQRLKDVKAESALRFPRKDGMSYNEARGAGEPQILSSIPGIVGSLGIPLDNHCAVSNNGTVVSVANFHITVYNPEGVLQSPVQSLIKFSRPLGLPNLRFDPRVMYDQSQDRWIIVMLSGTTVDETHIIVAFSKTEDPMGEWNLYALDGNPFDLNIFSDYPMLALSNTDFIVTINAVNVDSTWQAGFVETYIWQLDKMDGFNGDSLTSKLWTDAEYQGRNIRNVCPVTPGTERLDDYVYFMSDRNFDIQNDTFYLLKLTGGINDPDAKLEVSALISDVTYGVPPNAKQPTLELQTNDARVLDAFLENDKIQFVANTIDTATGKAVIYHGIIDDVNNPTGVRGKIITHGDHELGYPDISYAGVAPGDDHAFIVASHVSETRFPGHSVLEFDGDEYSPWVTLAEGENFISLIGGSVQRWGDYSGNSRRYSSPGVAWTVSSYGRTGNLYGLWISEIARSDINVNTKEIEKKQTSIAYPNPFTDFISVKFNMPKVDKVIIELHDMSGRLVHRFFETQPKQAGECVFSFSPQNLDSGSYILTVKTEDGLSISKQVQYLK